jgi:ATP-dependent Clp protease, protease subunit
LHCCYNKFKIYNKVYIFFVILPIVYDNGARSDIYSRLLEDRIIFLCGQINDEVASSICAQLLFLESKDKEKDIYLYVNSPGGSVISTLAIYDTMQYVAPDVSTICFGQCASGGSLVLTAGAKGKRYCLPNSLVMIHQPLAYGLGGQASDLSIHVEEINRQKKLIESIYEKHTKMSLKKIKQDTDRDRYITPEEAVENGIVDEIVSFRSTKTLN